VIQSLGKISEVKEVTNVLEINEDKNAFFRQTCLVGSWDGFGKVRERMIQ
jgi:hypothetical protein